MSFAYRHDIDGLRAFAVISVVIFHIQEHWLPSGFLGVDMFFVISGFLISTQLLNQISSGTFSLTEFYRRRVKRIVPAMLFVVSITITLSLFWLLPEDAEKAAESAAFAVASMANVYFWLFQDTGYFAESSLELPLLHLWSLGVEEQFYVFWPLILIALSSLLKSVRIIIFTTAIAATSFFLGSYLYDFSATFTYYMLPTRAGELLVGSISAILLFQKRTKTFLQAKSISRFIWWSGVTLVAISFWYLNPGYTFPGAHAILPTVGLSLMLLGGSGYNGKAVKLLSLKPLVFFGTISYSLYLWHWPVMAFYRYANYEITPASGVMLFIFMTAISWLTYKFIEESFRHSTESAAKVFIKQLAVPSAIIIFACLAIMKTDGKLVRYIQPDYLPLLEEVGYVPKEKYSYAKEILEYSQKLGRHFDLFDAFGQAQALGLGDDRIADLVLEARIGVDDVPARHVTLSYSRSGPAGREAEQPLDDRAEEGVDAEEEEPQQRGHDDDHHASHHRFATGRPHDFRRFGLHLIDEFAGGNLRHRLPFHLRINANSRSNSPPSRSRLFQRPGARPPAPVVRRIVSRSTLGPFARVDR